MQAIIFSLHISLISRQVKIVFGGGWKLLLRRHSEWGAWQWYFTSFTSLALLGWLNKAHTFCANLLQLGTPSTANNSLHQSGVLVILAFHVTHLQNSPNGDSGGGPSSSKLSTYPLRKEVTPDSNSSGSPRSESCGVSFPLPDSGLSLGR